jgi:hypothetical protein
VTRESTRLEAAQICRSVLDARTIHGFGVLDGLVCNPSGAVVLHVSDDGLPALSVPSVYMTAVRSGPIAVPDLTHPSRACLERGEATLHETRLAFHEPTLSWIKSISSGPRQNCRSALAEALLIGQSVCTQGMGHWRKDVSVTTKSGAAVLAVRAPDGITATPGWSI